MNGKSENASRILAAAGPRAIVQPWHFWLGNGAVSLCESGSSSRGYSMVKPGGMTQSGGSHPLGSRLSRRPMADSFVVEWHVENLWGRCFQPNRMLFSRSKERKFPVVASDMQFLVFGLLQLVVHHAAWISDQKLFAWTFKQTRLPLSTMFHMFCACAANQPISLTGLIEADVNNSNAWAPTAVWPDACPVEICANEERDWSPGWIRWCSDRWSSAELKAPGSKLMDNRSRWRKRNQNQSIVKFLQANSSRHKWPDGFKLTGSSIRWGGERPVEAPSLACYSYSMSCVGRFRCWLFDFV